MQFTCDITDNALRLHIGKHEGSYSAWWKQIKAEIYGWKPVKGTVVTDAAKIPVLLTQEAEGFSFEVIDNGEGTEVLVQ